MDSSPAGSGLHLPDLSISGFGGIENLEIGRLGRVTLLTGRNGVGKTTVLEAVRVFASRGNIRELADILMNRGEHCLIINDDGDQVPAPNASALFFDRRVASEGISIGSPRRDTVSIREATPTDEQMSLLASSKRGFKGDGPARVLEKAPTETIGKSCHCTSRGNGLRPNCSTRFTHTG